MIHRAHLAICAAASLLVAVPLFAQQQIPVRALSPPVATDSGVLFSISGIRSISGGKVLVDDFARRRILVFDSTLSKFSVGADSAMAAKSRYGTQMARLMPFTGDSSVMVDRESQVLVVIDPSGNTGRTMAPPRATDLFQIVAAGGVPGFDPQGRIIYRVSRRLAGRPPADVMDGNGKVRVTPEPDSAAIVRGDFDTRTVDTIATIKIPVSKSVSISTSPNSYSVTSAINPLPSTDELGAAARRHHRDRARAGLPHRLAAPRRHGDVHVENAVRLAPHHARGEGSAARFGETLD
jgi:hypothetical protein